MIVRVFNQGQVEVDDDVVLKLNEIDGDLEKAVETLDHEAFTAALKRIHDVIAANGKPLDESQQYLPSDAIVPDLEATIDEVRWLFEEDGLIPG